MKKTYVIITAIVLIALAFSFCSKSSGPTPDFKYLGNWLGLTQYTDTIAVTISNVSNKEKITTIQLYYPNIDGTPGYQEIIYTDSDGIAEVTNDAFDFTKPGAEPGSQVNIKGTFQSVTQLAGIFMAYTATDTVQGTYTATKQ
ncbi:MAG: hypothetical protein P9M09_01200 [Candidatus Celaenobacter antarcticus]|nr:hypothetical protein [Candidatus Celaenobacter antarcticus]